MNKIIVLALIAMTVSLSIPAYGDMESIVSDKSIYQKGETIVFSGTVGDLDVSESITMIVRDSEDNFVILETSASDSQGNFQLSLDIDANFINEGLYSAQLYLNDVATDEFTYFDFSSDGSVINHSAEEKNLLSSQQTKSNFKEIITIDQVQLADGVGNFVEYASDQNPVQISSDIINNKEHNQLFTYLVQIQDDSEQVISMSWFSGMLSSKQTFDVSLSWTPESQGIYKATVFVWDDLKDPLPLSEPQSIHVIVA